MQAAVFAREDRRRYAARSRAGEGPGAGAHPAPAGFAGRTCMRRNIRISSSTWQTGRQPVGDGCRSRRRLRARILLRGRGVRSGHRPRLAPGHAGLLDADDAGGRDGAGHRLFQRYRRRVRAIHAAGGPDAAAGAERSAGLQRRADRADRGGLARCAERRLAPEDVPLVVGCGPVGLAVIAGLVHQECPSDHRRRFFARSPGAGAEDGRRHRDRSGGGVAVRDLATRRRRRRVTMAAATLSCSGRAPSCARR